MFSTLQSVVIVVVVVIVGITVVMLVDFQCFKCNLLTCLIFAAIKSDDLLESCTMGCLSCCSFSIYSTWVLVSIIHHSFADDLQLQMSAPPDRISELLHSMQSCISDVKAWATVNMLRLNDSKYRTHACHL